MNVTRLGLSGLLLFCLTAFGGDRREAKPQTLFRIKRDGLYGYANAKGDVVISPTYKNADDFHEGLAAVQDEGNYGFINANGTFVIPPQFKRAYMFSEGLAACRKDKKYGFVNRQGKVVIGERFDRAWKFNEGVACVQIGELYGAIDKNGNVVIEPRFQERFDFSEGLASTRESGQYGFKDEHGQWVTKAGKYGFIDKKGEWAIAPRYDTYGPSRFSEGMAPVREGDSLFYIDKKGEKAFETRFSGAWPFSEGLARVQNAVQEIGYIDKTGKAVIDYRFSNWYRGTFSVYGFSEGLDAFNSSDAFRRELFGYIDKNGTVVIEPQFDRVSSFRNGLARVEIDSRSGYVDKNGRYVIGLEAYRGYTEISEIEFRDGRRDTRTVFKKDGSVQYRDRKLDFPMTLDGKRNRRAVLEKMTAVIEGNGLDIPVIRRKWVGKIDKQTFLKLARLLQSNGFFDMRELYSRGVPHESPVILSAVRNGKKKVVQNNSGMGPSELWGIEMAIRGVLKGIKWDDQQEDVEVEEPAKHTPPPRKKQILVSDPETGLVVISLGRIDGVESGMSYRVVREGKEITTISVKDVREDISTAAVTEPDTAGKIKNGDAIERIAGRNNTASGGPAEGQVLAVDPETGIVVISIGKQHGIGKGDELKAYRNGKVTATIRVISSFPDMASALVTEKEALEKISAGDEVRKTD